MEIGYSNISSNKQAVQGNGQPEQSAQISKVQSQTGDISSLSAGKMFQGEVLDIKGSQVSIGLDNGQVLNAKMDSDVNLTVGQKLTFEVKSNSGTHIEIKPALDAVNPNPVLQKALQAANIPITDRNMEMVSDMLKEGMSIDKQSLANMLRQFSINSNADASTLVKMNKLGIAATPENVAQFDNYKNYEHRLVKDIDNIATNLVKLLSETLGEDKNLAVSLNNKLVDILNQNNNTANGVLNSRQDVNVSLNPSASNANVLDQGIILNKDGQLVDPKVNEQVQNTKGTLGNLVLQEESSVVPKDITKAENIVLESLNGKDTINNRQDVTNRLDINTIINSNEENINKAALNVNETIDAAASTIGKNTNSTNSMNNFINPDSLHNTSNDSNLIQNENSMQATKHGMVLENILNSEERSNLAEKLKMLGADLSQIELVKDGKIENKELLNMVKTLLNNAGNAQNAEMLFASKEYNEVLRQSIKQQWLVEPENLKEPNKMEDFYRQMDEQTKQISKMLETIGKETSSAFKDVSNVRSNLNFMEQINQNFTYMQIPVQFTNEQAHSDLYVYTNKKNLKNQDGNLSVLLHLDMEVLGTTDIYIQMNGNSVNAKFSLKDKEAIELVADNLDSLIEKLEEKGYRANAQVGTIEKEQDFVEDFLEKDKVVTSLKRYAFDVKA